jgi:hypothetical protein
MRGRGGSGRKLGTVCAVALGCAVASAPAGARLVGVVHHPRHSRHAVRAAAEGGCPIFPADNAINEEVATLPESPNSRQYVESIGLSAHLHPDFGNNPAYGIPYEVVGASQPKVPVKFTKYRSESDPGPYPIPTDAAIEGGGKKGKGDKHVLVVQEGSCIDYELYKAARAKTGESWKAAAGLPIFPLLARYQDVASGTIDHALRVTVPESQEGYIHPATHFASSSSNPSLPPMGLRLRLQASFPLQGYSGQALVILVALKRYGLIVADNGSPWYVTGAPSPGWNEASLAELKQIPGSAFEAVETGPIIH